MPRPNHMKTQEKVKDAKGTLKKFLKLLKPYRLVFIISFASAFVGVLLSCLAPNFLGQLTTEIADGFAAKQMNWDAIKRLMKILICLYVCAPIFRFSQHFILAGLSGRIVADLRKKLNEKLDRMPLRYFDSKPQGEIMSRLTNDLDRIDESLQEGISQIIISFFTLSILFVVMITTNVVMTLTSLVVIPISLFIIGTVVKFTQKFFVSNQKYLGELNGHIEEIYGGHSVVKAFNHESAAMDKFDNLNNELYTAGWKSNFYSSVIFPLTGFAGNFGYILVVVVGAIMASKSLITIGAIQAFVQYTKRFNMPIQEIANISNVFQSTLAAAERVFEVLEEPEEDAGGDTKTDSAEGNVKFDNVFFSYVPEKKLIQNFNLDIKKGTKVAIVGPTGAGKTTLVNLLMRFYDVNEGHIFVDGVDIKDWNRDSLRDQFGMVLQDTWLFDGTIAQNIGYGSGTDEIDMEKVKFCAKQACADHFIETLPGGYDFRINEEASNISQGEKQLLTIARAFMSDPRMLILDEATSNVDTRTERLVQTAMENLMKNRTSFIIAHRLSTIRDADVILVIRDGNIVEKGKHQELLDAKGFYYQLYMSQFTGTLVED